MAVMGPCASTAVVLVTAPAIAQHHAVTDLAPLLGVLSMTAEHLLAERTMTVEITTDRAPQVTVMVVMVLRKGGAEMPVSAVAGYILSTTLFLLCA